MSEETNIHASCVAVDGHGVLLLGASGAGKSDLALMLMDGGAQLVADDRTILFAKAGTLHAKAPASIRGLLEIRGVGIVQRPARPRCACGLSVRLGKEGARLPGPRFLPPAGLRRCRKSRWIRASPPRRPRIRAALAAFVRGQLPRHFSLEIAAFQHQITLSGASGFCYCPRRSKEPS